VPWRAKCICVFTLIATPFAGMIRIRF